MSPPHGPARVRLTLLLLALLSFGARAQTAIDRPRTIRVVTDDVYVPYVFRAEDGRLQGILIDQWRAWEKKTGLKVEIQGMDWADALQRMRAGEFDVIDTIVETEERRGYFDFTPPYATIEVPIFFRADISGITDLASLKGFPVGVKEGDQHIDKLRATGVTTLVPFPNFDAMIQAAKQHKINVFVADAPAALYLLNRAGIAADFRHSAPIFQDGLQRAVRKGNPAMLRMVSDGFAAIGSSELKQIDEKWFGRTINWSGPYLAYAGYAVAAAILIIAALAVWNRTLRIRVLERTAALAESEMRYRLVLDTVPMMVWTILPDGRLDFLNQRWLEFAGMSLAAAIQDPTATVFPKDLPEMLEKWELAMAAKKPFEQEMRLRRADGVYRWFLVRTVPMLNEQGAVLKWYGTSMDIEDRKRAERQWHVLIDAIPQQIWSGPPDGTLDYCNDRWRSYMGLQLEDLQGDGWQAMLYPEDRARVLAAWRESVAQGTPYEQEERHRGADGIYRWFLARGVPLHDTEGNIVRWYGTNTDIEDRKRAEEELARHSQLLQLLSRRLFEVQEEERRHLARELHDEISQTLTAAKLNLRMIAPDVPPAVGGRLEDSIQIIDRLLTQVRQISLNLRPPLLDELGLVPALRWLADQQGQRANLPITFTANTDPLKLDPMIQTACFRVAQEALTNAIRHARATTVNVEVRAQPDRVSLEIRDDGVGFDEGTSQQRARGGSTVGLLSMKERVCLLGGEFKVHSTPGHGTKICAWFPLPVPARGLPSEIL